jgi:GNAT superfamily N-acetyltransferase
MMYMLRVLTKGMLFTLLVFATSVHAGEGDGIVPYDRDRDEEQVRKIAIQNKGKLVTASHTLSDDAFWDMIQGGLDAEGTFTNVLLVDGQAVGFIHYYDVMPWHRVMAPADTGPNVEIFSLAVNLEFRGNGYGTALLQTAIDEARERGANRVQLWETDARRNSLENFYPRFGFEAGMEQGTINRELQWRLRLKPHPMSVATSRTLATLGSSFMRWFRK